MKKKENPRDSGEMIKIETSRKLSKVQHHDKGLCRKSLLFSFFFKRKFPNKLEIMKTCEWSQVYLQKQRENGVRSVQ